MALRRSRNTAWGPAVVGVVLGSAGALRAQEPPTVGTPIKMEKEIIITATRVEAGLYDVPQSVTVVTPEEIDRRLARTPAEMLREEPGLWVQQTGHSGGAPILRGQIGNRVLYLWDGVRINNGALFGGPNAFLQQIQPGAIERIEVIRGPAAVQYGSDAIGGVINVITKRGNEFPEDVRYGVRTHTQYGTVNRELTDFADVSVAAPSFNLMAGGTLQDVDNYMGGSGAGTLGNTSYRDHGYYGRAGLKLSETQRVWIGWQDFERDNVQQYVQSKLNASGAPRLRGPFEDRSLLKLDYEGSDLSGWLGELKGYAYLQNLEARSTRLVETGAVFNNTVTDGHQWMWGLGAQGTSRLGGDPKHRLIYGLDFRFEEFRSHVTLNSTSKATGVTTVSKPVGRTPGGGYDAVDVFTLYELPLGEGWTVTPGVRFESAHLASAPDALDPVPPFTMDDLDLDNRWNSFTWSVGSVYWLDDHWNVAANVATGFRAPTFGDTLSFGTPFFATGVASIPSPSVDPEHSITYELGPRIASDRWEGALTGYWTVLTDLVQQVPAGTVDVPGVGTVGALQNGNVGRGYVRGFDVAMSCRLSDEWTLFGNYMEAYGQDTKNDVPLRFIPPRTALVGARWKTSENKCWIEGLLRVADRKRRHAPDDEIDAAFAEDTARGSPNTTTNPPLRTGFQIPGYAVFTLRGGLRLFTWDKATGDLTLEVENLFNHNYRQAFSRQLTEPGRNFFVALDFRF